MNVQELIDALEKIEDKTLEVSTEGCDCIGDTGSVELDGPGAVIINRKVDVARVGIKPALPSWRDKLSDREKELLP